MSSPARGAVLVAAAALLAFLVLRGAADTTQFPVASAGVAVPTPTVLEVDSENAVPVTTPTVEIDPTLARPNGEVRVLVANGSDVNGQATRLTSTLRNRGFLTREPRNADTQEVSTIFYRPGFAAEATIVRTVLGGSTPIAPMPEPDPVLGEGIDLAPVDVLVLIGGDDLSTS